MNWGYKILFVYIGFVAMILGMVFVASKQTNEMQDENYYMKELHYQDVIDGKNNLTALRGHVQITDTLNAIMVQIPELAAANVTGGKAFFMRPSDEHKDKHLIFAPAANGVQTFPLSYFSKGLYTVQLSWKSNGKMYFAEDKIMVSQ